MNKIPDDSYWRYELSLWQLGLSSSMVENYAKASKLTTNSKM